MDAAERLLHDFGPALVFANVLLERLGIPIPTVPTLIVSGASAAQSEHSLAMVFAVAVLGCAIGDGTWYLLGRRYGMRVLRLLCRMSLSADSCVRQTTSHFERWGAWTVLLGKFIPGVAAVAAPLAGVMGMHGPKFALLTVGGSALWAALAIGAGALFRRQVNELLDRLTDYGLIAGLVVGALLAAYIALKWWERRRFHKAMRMARITADELHSLMHGTEKPVIVDLRGRAERLSEGRAIPGAWALDLSQVERRIADFPAEREIIFYCNCPNEASAATAAKALLSLGYVRVRPLLGGLDAWVAAGYDTEPVVRAPE